MNKLGDGNVLIAEFMGVKLVTLDDIRANQVNKIASAEGNLKEDLKYHVSWDWLMPVVKAIETHHQGVPRQLINTSMYDQLTEVYFAVVEYIVEFNREPTIQEKLAHYYELDLNNGIELQMSHRDWIEEIAKVIADPKTYLREFEEEYKEYKEMLNA